MFPDVLKNMQTEDLEQKKLVYLYLINYAKTQPELVILAVNTFVKVGLYDVWKFHSDQYSNVNSMYQDTDDPNPLIRALAIRTMGVLRAEKIIDYISDPLRKCVRDDNPYVRKTAALSIAKLYDMNPGLAMDHGFIEMLQEMVGDSNPSVSRLKYLQSTVRAQRLRAVLQVVANAITALAEIEDAATEESGQSGTIFALNSQNLQKLLVALGECTEWGRIAILTAISRYQTQDEREAEQICERITPQFQHANGSVVLAAIKVCLNGLVKASAYI